MKKQSQKPLKACHLSGIMFEWLDYLDLKAKKAKGKTIKGKTIKKSK
jgi:hypothetical protein